MKGKLTVLIMLAVSAGLLLTACGGASAPPARTSSLTAGETVVWDMPSGTPLEWLVLEVKDGKALLLTKDCVAMRQYDDEIRSVTWENCTLRKWLNQDFYDTFTDARKRSIADSTVVNNDNSEYWTSSGKDTTDKIFLLSLSEAGRYFSSDRERIARYDGEAVDWWLRSPGINDDHAAIVYNVGYFNSLGFSVDDRDVAVRPALWVNL